MAAETQAWGDGWLGCCDSYDGVMTGRAVAISYDSWLSTKMSRTNVYQCWLQRRVWWRMGGMWRVLGVLLGVENAEVGARKTMKNSTQLPVSGEPSFRHIR